MPHRQHIPDRPPLRPGQDDSASKLTRAGATRDLRRLIQFRWLLATGLMNLLMIGIDQRYIDRGLSIEGFSLAVSLRVLVGAPLVLFALAINRWSKNRDVLTASNGLATVALVIVNTVISRQLPEPLSSRYMMGIEFLIYAAALYAALPWRATLVMTAVSTIAYTAIISDLFHFPHQLANLDLIAFNLLMAIGALYTRRRADDQVEQIKAMRRIDAERAEELRKANGHLARISSTDALTGAFNRRYLDEFVAQAFHSIAPARSCGLLMIDVDHFKLFNDRAGHVEGDDCLRRVAYGIRTAMRTEQDFVVRYGGEEFAAILPDADLQETLAVAERVRRAVHHLQIKHPGLGAGAVVTVSIGACIANPEEGIFDAIHRADKFLYTAKNQGRDCVAA